MEYIGKLYGKIAGKYFDTGATSDDWDDLKEKIDELQTKLNKSNHNIIPTDIRIIEKANEYNSEFSDDAFIAGAKWFRGFVK